jgi:uncharacterized protein YfaS (alpha-2-macroglobulin family)
MRRRRDRKAAAAPISAAVALALLSSSALSAGSEGIDRPAPPPAAEQPAPPSTPQPQTAPDVFALTGVETAVERDQPEICAVFSKIPDPEQPVSGPTGGLIGLTAEEGEAAPVNLTRRGRSLCLGGLEHARRYRLTFSGDLRAVDGRMLGSGVDRTVETAERRPSLAFRDAGFLLSRVGDGRADGDLALRSINVATATVRLLRLTNVEGVERAYFEAGDPALVDRLAKDAKEVWSGAIALGPLRNRALTTPLPLTAVAGKLEPGVYVAAAEAEGERTRQWFIVSDLAVNTVTGDDGLLVFARSRASAEPMEGVTLKIANRDRSEAAVTRTGPDGLARIDSAQLAGAGERTPQVLLARRGADVAVVELSGPRNALGVEADENPFQRSRLDAFIGLDRPVYAPGDTLNAVALLRDTDGREAAGEKLIAELRRPDGAPAARLPLTDDAAAAGGGYAFSLRLPGAAQSGDWRLSLHEEADGEEVGAATLRVSDARPLGLTLALDAAVDFPGEREAAPPDARPAPDARPTVRLNLHVAAANGRPVAGMSGQVYVAARRPQTDLPQFPGYVFSQDLPPGERKLLGSFTADAQGRATLQLPLPDGLPFRSAFDARIEAEAQVAGAPAARAEILLPYRPRPVAVGLRPRFEGPGAPDGATVAFDVVAVDGASGRPVEVKGLTYELVREETAFEWFDNQGRWDYRQAVRDRVTAGGALDVGTGGPAVISEPVGAGRYRLEARDPATGAVASHRFAAGWWMSPQAGARPDRVEVTAIRPGARAEGKAWVFVRPPYAGEVLILVADQRVRRAETRAIGPDGAFIEIPADYGARGGAHVAAVAFAAPDPAYRGPPRRAAGSAWLPSLDGPHRLTTTLEAVPATDSAPAQIKLRALNSRKEGGAAEPIHAVAALLPADAAENAFGDPVRRFFGEQPLGVSVRDIYGKLISPPDRKAEREESAARPVVAVKPGALWLSDILHLNADGETVVTVVPPPGTPAGAYRVTVLTWDATAMGRAETTLTLPTGAPPVPGPTRPFVSAPTGWRRDRVIDIPANGDAPRPDFPAGPALLLTEAAALPDLDLGEAAGKQINPLPPLGAQAAAARLIGLASLRLPGFERDRAAAAALDELLAMQRPDGAFSAWSPTGAADPWLTAYALDALNRRRRSDGDAPDPAVAAAVGVAESAARDWLRRWWDGCRTDPANLSSCVYALAMLTEAKKLDAGAVAFFAEGFALQLPSELARAHLAAAWDNVGDRRQTEAALARVAGGRRVDAVTRDQHGSAVRDHGSAVRDHGSAVRDAAAAVAVMAERRAGADMLTAAVQRLQRTRAATFFLSEQEAAWLLSAARALTPPGAATPGLILPPATGGLMSPPATGETPVLRNGEAAPARFSLLLPADDAADPAAGKLTQRLTDLTGRDADPAATAPGDALAVTFEATFEPEDRPRLLRLSARPPDNTQALTAPAPITEDDKTDKPAVEALRSRTDASGVTAVILVPPGVGKVKLSYLLRVVGPGPATGGGAVIESLGRGGRVGRLISRGG